MTRRNKKSAAGSAAAKSPRLSDDPTVNAEYVIDELTKVLNAYARDHGYPDHDAMYADVLRDIRLMSKYESFYSAKTAITDINYALEHDGSGDFFRALNNTIGNIANNGLRHGRTDPFFKFAESIQYWRKDPGIITAALDRRAATESRYAREDAALRTTINRIIDEFTAKCDAIAAERRVVEAALAGDKIISINITADDASYAKMLERLNAERKAYVERRDSLRYPLRTRINLLRDQIASYATTGINTGVTVNYGEISNLQARLAAIARAKLGGWF